MSQTLGYDAHPGRPHRGEPDYYDDQDPNSVPGARLDGQRAHRGGQRRRPAPRRRLGRLGSMPGRFGVFVVIACTALGALVTMLAGVQPGVVLAVFLLAGTAVAAVAVRQRSSYLVIPVPALAYPVAAVIAGIADQPGGLSTATLAVGGLQWLGEGFLTMLAATALATCIAGARHWRAR